MFISISNKCRLGEHKRKKNLTDPKRFIVCVCVRVYLYYYYYYYYYYFTVHDIGSVLLMFFGSTSWPYWFVERQVSGCCPSILGLPLTACVFIQSSAKVTCWPMCLLGHWVTWSFFLCILDVYFTSRIPEMLGRFLNFNKMKTKRLSNHMSQYFIHNRT